MFKYIFPPRMKKQIFFCYVWKLVLKEDKEEEKSILFFLQLFIFPLRSGLVEELDTLLHLGALNVTVKYSFKDRKFYVYGRILSWCINILHT